MRQTQGLSLDAVPPAGRALERLVLLLRVGAIAEAGVAAIAVVRGLPPILRTSPTSLKDIISLDPFSFQVVVLIGVALLVLVGALLVAGQTAKDSTGKRVLGTSFLLIGAFLLLVLFRIISSLTAGGPRV